VQHLNHRGLQHAWEEMQVGQLGTTRYGRVHELVVSANKMNFIFKNIKGMNDIL